MTGVALCGFGLWVTSNAIIESKSQGKYCLHMFLIKASCMVFDPLQKFVNVMNLQKAMQ